MLPRPRVRVNDQASATVRARLRRPRWAHTRQSQRKCHSEACLLFRLTRPDVHAPLRDMSTKQQAAVRKRRVHSPHAISLPDDETVWPGGENDHEFAAGGEAPVLAVHGHGGFGVGDRSPRRLRLRRAQFRNDQNKIWRTQSEPSGVGGHEIASLRERIDLQDSPCLPASGHRRAPARPRQESGR